MIFDVEKLKQAGVELLLTFGVAFALSFFGWVSGWTELPNLEAGESALRAALLGGATALGKGVLWFLTGTKIVGDKVKGGPKEAARL